MTSPNATTCRTQPVEPGSYGCSSTVTDFPQAERDGVITRMIEFAISSTKDQAAPLIGVYDHAALASEEAEVRYLLGDIPGAISALHTSLRHRPTTERRSRAILLARLAELQLRAGRLDQAITTWHHFLDEFPALSCGRAITALKTMRACLRPYARSPAAASVLHHAATLTTPTTAPRRTARSPG
ncbi:hypothetical protein [Nonomuraea sp. NPDC050643]|uniref:tetratricopeptide repeat protein n=1 Tax=Nonomuraea sp. NPDC050643 TaxID=3155660 RepID=UPI0033D83CB7